MVENKDSVYDEHNPPLVPVILFTNEAYLTQTRNQQDTTFQPPQPPTNTIPTMPAPIRQDNNINSNANENKDPRMVASGIAGATFGLLLGGPFIAALFGFGSAYATQQPGASGDAARALGEVAIAAKEKAEELDRKHNLVEKSKQAAAEAWEQAKEYDRRHNVMEQAKEFAIFSWRSFAQFVQDNRLLERSVEGVGRGLEYVTERVLTDENENSAGQQPRA